MIALLLTNALIVILNSAFVEAQYYYPYGETEISAKDAFEQNGLTPDFVPKAPESTASVSYPFGIHRVDLGNQMEFEDTVIPPTVDWDADSNALYTLIMFDPDVPTPETRYLESPRLHWLIANIPGNDPKAGETWASYLHPNPSPGQVHRYTFVIYKQSRKVANDLSTDSFGSVIRNHFSIAKYTSQHNISGPVAGNFFFEQSLGNRFT